MTYSQMPVTQLKGIFFSRMKRMFPEREPYRDFYVPRNKKEYIERIENLKELK